MELEFAACKSAEELQRDSVLKNRACVSVTRAMKDPKPLSCEVSKVLCTSCHPIGCGYRRQLFWSPGSMDAGGAEVPLALMLGGTGGAGSWAEGVDHVEDIGPAIRSFQLRSLQGQETKTVHLDFTLKYLSSSAALSGANDVAGPTFFRGESGDKKYSWRKNGYVEQGKTVFVYPAVSSSCFYHTCDNGTRALQYNYPRRVCKERRCCVMASRSTVLLVGG